jgi:hypothetical protein
MKNEYTRTRLREEEEEQENHIVKGEDSYAHVLLVFSLSFFSQFTVRYTGGAAAADVDFTAIYDFIYPNLIIEETHRNYYLNNRLPV